MQSVPQALAVSNPFNLSIPTTTTNASLPPPPANRSDFPLVSFWYKRDWIAFQKDNKGLSNPNRRASERGRVRASQGENVKMLFVEDEEGNPIDGHKATEIRRIARSIWVEFAKNGKAPKTWCKADISTAQEYNNEMRRFFPELRLCEFDWKAEQIAIENYPSWHQNYFKDKDKAPKNEAVDVSLNVDSSSEAAPARSKRHTSDPAAGHVTKKKKPSTMHASALTPSSSPAQTFARISGTVSTSSSGRENDAVRLETDAKGNESLTVSL